MLSSAKSSALCAGDGSGVTALLLAAAIAVDSPAVSDCDPRTGCRAPAAVAKVPRLAPVPADAEVAVALLSLG